MHGIPGWRSAKMRCAILSRILILSAIVSLLWAVSSALFFPSSSLSAEEYTFDVSETEKKAFQIGGYIEAMPIPVIHHQK